MELVKFKVEMMFYMQEIDDIPTGDIYSKMYDVVIKGEQNNINNLDYAYAIAYQKLLDDVINELQLQRKHNCVYDDFELYDIAAKMVVMNCANIYDVNGEITEVH